MRLHALNAIREGLDAPSVAAYGLNIHSAYRWLILPTAVRRRYWPNQILGRPPRITTEQMQWLAQAVREHTPLQYKFDFGLWTLSLIYALVGANSVALSNDTAGIQCAETVASMAA